MKRMNVSSRNVFVLRCCTVILACFGCIWLSTKEGEISTPNKIRSKNLQKKKMHLTLPENTSLDDENQLSEYFNYVNQRQAFCQQQRVCGPNSDAAGYDVCEDFKYAPSIPCIVYSFGSAFRFGFEVGVIKNYQCEVHTFDPSVPLTKGHRSKIPAGVHFHLTGLAHDNFITGKGWKMQTLSSIIRELGHANKTIDILKIDIEGWEWKVLQQLLLSQTLKHVKQLALEVHFGPEMDSKTRYKTFSSNNWGFVSMKEQMHVLLQLEQNGFQIFRTKEMPASVVLLKQLRRKITTLNVLSLINTNNNNENNN